MATTVPLNFFKRTTTLVSQTQTPIYTVPSDVAGIIISAYASNLTPTPQNITVSLSATGVSSSQYTILNSYTLPPNDAVNIAINKIVLTEGDSFIVSSENVNSVNLTLSILESVNIP
jgi:hypothetical protein